MAGPVANEGAAATLANASHVGANITLLIVVMLLAGLLGGTVNYFLRSPQSASTSQGHWWVRFLNNRMLFQCLLMGVAAAFVIPVFLQLAAIGVDKNIITIFLVNAGATDNAEELAKAYSSLALIGGFCVLAAISSPTFLQNLSSKILQQAEQAKTAAVQARSEAEEASKQAKLADDARAPEINARIEALRAELQGAVPVEDPDDDQIEATPVNEITVEETAQLQTDQREGFKLSELDQLILRALAAKPNTRRSIKGIRTDAILTKSENHSEESYASVRSRLYRLASANYVEEVAATAGNLPRWKLRTKGWAQL